MSVAPYLQLRQEEEPELAAVPAVQQAGEPVAEELVAFEVVESVQVDIGAEVAAASVPVLEAVASVWELEAVLEQEAVAFVPVEVEWALEVAASKQGLEVVLAGRVGQEVELAEVAERTAYLRF